MDMETFFNRDLTWLSFNERVLMEAAKEEVPLLERIKFLAIYSSNLDEFYRVRIPVLMVIDNLGKDDPGVYSAAKDFINRQLQVYGSILKNQLIPALEKQEIYWIYDAAIPTFLEAQVNEIFFNEVLAFIHPYRIIDNQEGFFAENNALYLAVMLTHPGDSEQLVFVNIPNNDLPRFYTLSSGGRSYVVFLDDIIKHHLSYLFPGLQIQGVYSIKVTRDAELRLEEEIDNDIALMMEKELAKRDLGFATRFLCEPGIPLRHVYLMVCALHLNKAAVVSGGVYHNLKDLQQFPLPDPRFSYPKWPAISAVNIPADTTLFDRLSKKDVLIHTPYHSYHPVLRFFNEAAHDTTVISIYCTFYRLANPSRLVQALVTAAKNGKKVTVMLELKARFDEANNIKWARQMKAAGITLIYSSVSFKVHAKVALVQRSAGAAQRYLGLLATGNMNETTAKFYTDHILLTTHQPMLSELEALFKFLAKKKKRPAKEDYISFQHLLVAQFNLHAQFMALIDREIEHAKQGLPARIQIKLNNLEEKVLISKLYEASCAGVNIELLVRSICCLVPGKPGQSENITVKRIVGRYLEHGRVFVFFNNGTPEVYIGSSDWMNRNIYSRIEVCFPIYDPELKQELLDMMTLQLSAEVTIPQESIYKLLTAKTAEVNK
jgi:polyphosphate kinase